MSTKVTELIREIEAFMRGKDLSATPQFRRMYTAYCDCCREAATALDACRTLATQGSLDEARRRNLAADPPLTTRVKMLQFAQKKEFVELALSYGFPAPVEADMALVAKLDSPVSRQEKNLQHLMRRWRQVARAGKTEEKISVLRDIVALIPPEGALEWKKNLASLERARDAEIAEITARETWTAGNLAQLESFYFELNFPKRLTVAPENTLQRVRELLIPLQKKHVAAEIEKKMDVLQTLYAERNLAALNQQFAEFLALASHPFADLTSAQQQSKQDIADFLQMENRRRQTQERFDQLVQTLEKAFEDGKSYEEVERIYNELQLLDLPLSHAIVEQFETLRYEYEAMERRRVIRRGIYAVGVVVLLLIALGTAIHYAMYFRSVRQTCESFDKLLIANDFQTVFIKYDELLKKSPRLARDSKVASRINRAHSMRDAFTQKQANANAEFLRARNRMETLKAKDFLDSKEIDDTFAEVDKLTPYLSKENRDAWGKLRGDIARRRVELQKERKKVFLEHYGKHLAQLQQIKENLPACADLAVQESEIKGIRQEHQTDCDRLHPSVREEIGKACDAEWKRLNDDLNHAFAREQKIREFSQKLDHPQDLAEHLLALREVPLQFPDFARQYQRMTEREIEHCEQLEYSIRFLGSSDLRSVLSGGTKIPDDCKNSLLGEDIAFVTVNSAASSVDDGFDKLLKAFDYYEVSFKLRSGPDLVLYAKTKPLIQRVNRENVRGIRINASLAVNAANPVPVNLKFRDKDTYSLEFSEKLAPTLANLTPVIEFSGVDLTTGDCTKNGTFLRLQSIRQQSGWTREKKLRTFITEECANKEKNPLIQLFALRKAFQLLAEESPLYAALTASVRSKLDAASAAFKGNLLQPHTLTHPDEIRAVIAGIEPEKLFAEKEKVENFYVQLLQRGLCCAGVIDQHGKLSPIAGCAPREWFVFADGGLYLLNSDLAGNKIVEQEKEYLFPGQVVWAFTDGVSNRDFFCRKMLNGAKLSKLPAQWPTNLHLGIY